MNKAFPLAFCILLLAGFGCAITDYGVITDNDQVSADKHGKAAAFNPVIDTRGKAHIRETSQVATIWPDGTDEMLSFVDQKADGTAKLTTYNNFSTSSEPTFHDDLYCDVNREGCAVFTAFDANDAELFDGELNVNCSGARSLSILISTGRYYGECGRTEARGNKLSLEQKASLFNSAVFASRMGREGLLFPVGADNLTVRMENENGESFLMPLRGSADFWASGQDNLALIDLQDTLLSSSMSWYAGFLDRDAGSVTTATLTYNGISTTFTMAGQHPTVNADTVRMLVHRAY